MRNSDKLCKARVQSRFGFGRYHQCSRQASVDGYCKTHHPDAVKKRRAARNERDERKFRALARSTLCEAIGRAVLERIEYSGQTVIKDYLKVTPEWVLSRYRDVD